MRTIRAIRRNRDPIQHIDGSLLRTSSSSSSDASVSVRARKGTNTPVAGMSIARYRIGSSGACAHELTAMKKLRIVTLGIRVGDRSRGRYATPPISRYGSPYSHVHVRRWGLGFVHRSKAILCRRTCQTLKSRFATSSSLYLSGRALLRRPAPPGYPPHSRREHPVAECVSLTGCATMRYAVRGMDSPLANMPLRSA